MGWVKGHWRGPRVEMIEWLAGLQIEPIWYEVADGQGRVGFRAIPIPRRRARFHGKALTSNTRAELLSVLEMDVDGRGRTKARAETVQKEIRLRAGIKNAPFGWRETNS